MKTVCCKLLDRYVQSYDIFVLKGIYLQVELDDDVPEYIRTDQGKLKQILTNLLGNAVKLIHSGGVTLKCQARTVNKPDQPVEYTMHFDVTDASVEIPESLHL